MQLSEIRGGDDLRRLRNQLGLTQKQLGEKFDVHQCIISQWEANPSHLNQRASMTIKDKFPTLFPKKQSTESVVYFITKPKKESPWVKFKDLGIEDEVLAMLLHMPIEAFNEHIKDNTIPIGGFRSQRFNLFKRVLDNEFEFVKKLSPNTVEALMSLLVLSPEKTLKQVAHEVQRNLNKVLFETNPRDMQDGDYFRRVRLNFRMTPQELAIVLEISVGAVYKFEKGEVPNPECVKLFRYLQNIWDKDDEVELAKISNWIMTKRFGVLGDYLRDEA